MQTITDEKLSDGKCTLEKFFFLKLEHTFSHFPLTSKQAAGLTMRV